VFQYHAVEWKKYTMKSELTIIPGTRIALFRSAGPIEFEDRMKNIGRMAQFCNENGIKGLIVDICLQVSNTRTMQMFDLGTSVPSTLRGIRIAVVSESSDQEARFGETVAANRGALSRLFTTVAEAQSWLEGKDVALNKLDAGDG
jgi:hypothetical protein